MSVRGKGAGRNLLVSIGIFTTIALGPRVLTAILTLGVSELCTNQFFIQLADAGARNRRHDTNLGRNGPF